MKSGLNINTIENVMRNKYESSTENGEIVSEPVRVLHVLGTLNIGGAEGYIMNIFRNIDRSLLQFDFAVHTSDVGFYEREIKELGGCIYHGAIRYRIINFCICYHFWKSFFKKHPYSCIHVHTYNMALPILKAAKKMGINYRICHSHSANQYGLIRKVHIIISRYFIRKWSSFRVAISDKAGRYVFGFNYKVIGNAINTEKFRYNAEKRNEVRRRLNLGNELVIGNVGGFRRPKNHSFMLDLFESLLQVLPAAKLVLVGGGGLQQRIKERVSQSGLDDNVIFLGVCDDIPDLLQAFDIFLMPSLFEGLPTAALEAQAAGLPCLLSDTISVEANVLKPLVKYLPIQRGTTHWADEIIQIAKNLPPRRDTYEEMKAAGVDINDITKWYEDFYINLTGIGNDKEKVFI